MTRTLMIKKIHIAKRQLGLADVEYRAMLHAATGKDSAGTMTDHDLIKVMDALKRAGWREGWRGRKKTGTPDAKSYIRKLWSDLAKLGVIADASDRALRAFVDRQTGVSAVEFLTPPQANKVIEGLKGWLARARAKSAGA